MRAAGAPLPPFRLRFGAGFVLLFALLFFFDRDGLVSALLPAMFMHELGHMLALLLLGCPPLALTASLTGFTLDYAGELTPAGRLTAALSGPLLGLVLALACARLGVRLESRFLLLSAGVGWAINLFNLLPVLPLDGGHALSVLLEALLKKKTSQRLMGLLGLLVPLGMILSGLFVLKSPGLPLAGAWLLALGLFRGLQRRPFGKKRVL